MDSADDGGAKVCELVTGAGGRGGSVSVTLVGKVVVGADSSGDDRGGMALPSCQVWGGCAPQMGWNPGPSRKRGLRVVGFMVWG